MPDNDRKTLTSERRCTTLAVTPPGSVPGTSNKLVAPAKTTELAALPLRSAMAVLALWSTMLAGCQQAPRGHAAIAPRVLTGGIGRGASLYDYGVIPTFHYTLSDPQPWQLTADDIQSIESIVRRVPGGGNPIIVTGVFVGWVNLSVAVSVLYRTNMYDIYLARDCRGTWFLSLVTGLPQP